MNIFLLEPKHKKILCLISSQIVLIVANRNIAQVSFLTPWRPFHGLKKLSSKKKNLPPAALPAHSNQGDSETTKFKIFFTLFVLILGSQMQKIIITIALAEGDEEKSKK
jgi:hypothetical protein